MGGVEADFVPLCSLIEDCFSCTFEEAVWSSGFAVSSSFFAFSPVEVLLIFNPPIPSFSLPFLRFRGPTDQLSVTVGGDTASSCSLAARSASSCCLRNSSRPSLVALFSASSLALAASCTESRNSISSSSSERNWLVNLVASSNASCFAAARAQTYPGQRRCFTID